MKKCPYKASQNLNLDLNHDLNLAFLRAQRCMTLLELLVALSLTSVLLMILMVFYRESTQLNSLSDQASREIFQESYLENRLSGVFSSLTPSQDLSRPFFFMTTEALASAGISIDNALVFSYNNGARWDRSFAGDVLGVLFVDRDGNLSLVTAPPPKEWKGKLEIPLHKEILMDKVNGISFSFLDIREPEVEEHDGQPEFVSSSTWEGKEANGKKGKRREMTLPAFMIVTLDKEGHGMRQFPFVLPRHKKPVLYTK